MEIKRAADREWKNAGYTGAERAILHLSKQQGRTSVVRFAAGARAPAHRHQAPEHAYVISGQVNIGGHILNAGDYLYTEPGEVHDLVALTDAVLFASTELPVVVLEETPEAQVS